MIGKRKHSGAIWAMGGSPPLPMIPNAAIHPPHPPKGGPPRIRKHLLPGRGGVWFEYRPRGGIVVGVSTLLLGRKGGPRGSPFSFFRFFSFCTLSKSLKFQGPPTGSKNQCFPTADGRSGPTNTMTIGLCPTSPRITLSLTQMSLSLRLRPV